MGINIGVCLFFVIVFVVLFVLVNELRVEISDAEKLSTVIRSDLVSLKFICFSGKR